MAGSRADRYARAAFELAQEEGDLEAWQRRLGAVRALLDHPDVRALLDNPTIAVAERQAVVEALATDDIGREGVNLAKLLVASGHVDMIDAVVEEFERLSDDSAGRVRATAVAAFELSPEEAENLRRRLSARLERDVHLELRVDPRVLGGLVVRYGDRLIDASLADRPQQLRRSLISA